MRPSRTTAETERGGNAPQMGPSPMLATRYHAAVRMANDHKTTPVPVGRARHPSANHERYC